MNANEAAVPSYDAQARVTAYEQPLNERMRNFLRLDFLYQQAVHHHTKPDPWSDARSGLGAARDPRDHAARRRAQRSAQGTRAADVAALGVHDAPGRGRDAAARAADEAASHARGTEHGRRAFHAEAARFGIPERDQAPQHHSGRHLRVRPAGLHALAEPARRNPRGRLRALARGDPPARRCRRRAALDDPRAGQDAPRSRFQWRFPRDARA